MKKVFFISKRYENVDFCISIEKAKRMIWM